MNINNNCLVELADRVKSNNSAHAYIIEGRGDMGRLLLQCAKVLLCPQQGCNECEICRKIDAHCHADCIELPPSENKDNKLLVADILYLIDESYRRPVDNSRCKVFVINATDSVAANNISWQNKLLKTLEEPTDGVYIIIGVPSADSLLATVVSRCQVLTFKPYATKEIKKQLKANGYNGKIAGLCAMLSDGHMDSAASMAHNGIYGDILDKVTDMLAHLTSTKNSLSYVSMLTSRDSYNNKLLPVMTVVLSESIKYRIDKQLVTLELESDIWQSIGNNYTIDACIASIQLINNANMQLARNMNYTVVIDNLIADIMEVKYRCRI